MNTIQLFKRKKAGRITRGFHGPMIALALMSAFCMRATAQSGSQRAVMSQSQEQDQAGALVSIVRQATARFQSVSVAESEGYALQFGCVSGDESGAMGL